MSLGLPVNEIRAVLLADRPYGTFPRGGSPEPPAPPAPPVGHRWYRPAPGPRAARIRRGAFFASLVLLALALLAPAPHPSGGDGESAEPAGRRQGARDRQPVRTHGLAFGGRGLRPRPHRAGAAARQIPRRAHPVRRRDQSRQLRRAALRRARRSRRHRRGCAGAGEADRCGHRLCRHHPERRRRARPAAGLERTNHVERPADPVLMERLLFEIKKVIVGQDRLLERIVVALLARGHLLVEGVPGLAKTLSVKTVAAAIQGEFKRVQFTPDLVPADLIGTRVYNQRSGEFQTSLGPVFTNLLLGDEINRAPAKVQSALLEVMQERQVTIGRETHRVPDPFLVMATQNPIETEGTYALPEAQIDRFMMKAVITYPTEMDEFVIVERMTGALSAVQPVLTTEQLIGLQREVDRVFVDPVLMEYVVRVVSATRIPKDYGLAESAKYITYGASPRASINLVLTARALAFMRGRDYVLAEDIKDVALDVLRHRLVLSYEALSDEVTSDALILKVLERIPVPVAPMQGHVAART